VRSVAFVALIAGCAARPLAPAPISAAAPPRPPPPVHHTVAIGVGTYATQLFYTQPGRVVAARDDVLELVDTTRLRPVGEVKRLSSEAGEDRLDPINHRISRDIQVATWAWDRGEPLGIVDVGGLGGADPAGLGVWRPASEPRPDYLTGRGGFYCVAVAISADHAMFVTSGCEPGDVMGKTMQIYATETREELATVAQRPTRAVFSPDGKQLVFATASHQLALYDLASERLTMLLQDHTQDVLAVAYHPTRPLVVSADGDAAIDAWDLAAGSHVRIAEKATKLAFSPDGRYLAAGYRSQLLVLDTRTWARALDPLKIAFSWGPDALAWSPDSRQLAAIVGGSTLELFDFAPGEPAAVDDAVWARVHRLPTPAPAQPPPIVNDGVIEGTITMAGKPVAGAELRLAPHPQEWPVARALVGPVGKSDRDGHCRMAHLPEISWNVTYSAPGTTLGGFVASLREEATVHVDLAVDPAVTIRGRVLGPDHRPARDVRIVHYRYDSVIEIDQRTGPDGTFVLDHLRPEGTSYDPASFQLGFEGADGAARSFRLDIRKPGPIDLPVTLRGPRDPHVVRVHVQDASGNPVANAQVSPNGSLGVPSDARGDAAIDIGDAKKLYLHVYASRGGTGEIPVDLPSRAPVTITLTSY